MLQLKNITKVYPSGDVTALSGVSISFRKNEFVSILGQSGCGKTTLLNIIGGLDRYSSGELYVRHKSTSQFTDRDWDNYRNHSIGFVFQSYNLIPHQSVLSNVELALTLSGVSKAERRRRAEEALRAVGLEDQMKKKPSQMSGGQMQRVAIARALVNNPDILLADEPTGALDSETSVQVMDILRDVAKEKLVIMVTHNPELAEQYSSRIIRVLDGRVISDSDPYAADEEEAEIYADSTGEMSRREKKSARKKNSMSFPTALGLSLNNLMTKKARTFLTAFAGSIGIIGIALIMSLSNGIDLYIDKVQEDTLSTYPIQINSETVDMTSMMTTLMEAGEAAEEEEFTDDGKIHSNVMMFDLMDTMMSVDVQENNLAKFIEFIENEHGGDFDGYASAVAYGYNTPLTIYSTTSKDESGVPEILNPSEMFAMMGPAGASSASNVSMGPMMSTNLAVWQEMIDNRDLMDQQYDIVAGEWPDEWNEVVLVVDEKNEINDVYLYALGFKDSAELKEMMKASMNGEKFNAESESWTYDEIIGHEFALVLPFELYRSSSGGWEYMGEDPVFMSNAVRDAEKIRISAIIKPDEEAVATSITGAVGYLPELSEHIRQITEESMIVQAQLANPAVDVLSGLEFETDDNTPDRLTAEEKAAFIRGAIADMTNADRAAAYTKILSTISDEDAAEQAAAQISAMPEDMLNASVMQALTAQSGMDEAAIAGYVQSMAEEEYDALVLRMFTEQVKAAYAAEMEKNLGTMTTDELASLLDSTLAEMSDEDVAEKFIEYLPRTTSDMTYEEVLDTLGYADREDPSFIRIYADSFDKKDEISRIITEYNKKCTDEGREEDVINYTDYVALMMSSVSTIINVISYILIAFVSISLIVSSIMIGIITYISVLERTKEIGILRAVGASKKDISRVFNAETFIIGLTSGTLGIVVTLLLCIPANAIIKHLTDVSNLARLPIDGGIMLIAISMILTVISGLIPSGIAAKKDPVEALRSE